MNAKDSSNAKLTGPLALTFSLLRQRKFKPSTHLLDRGLQSALPAIRKASLQALLDRGQAIDHSTILEWIDRATQEELVHIRQYARHMAPVIDRNFSSRDPDTRKRLLKTIAQFELHSHFPVLVDAACDPEDPNQLLAIEYLSGLAKSLAQQVRASDSKGREPRTVLLRELARGLGAYPKHRLHCLVEWWIAAAHPNDPIVAEIIRRAPQDAGAQRIVEHMERSKSKESMELVARFLWNETANPHVVAIAARRHDAPFIETLVSLYRNLGPTKELKKVANIPNLPWAFLSQDAFYEDRISMTAKIGLVELMALRSAAIEEILPRIAWLLENLDPSIEDQVAQVIQLLRPLNTDLAVLALSDSIDDPDMDTWTPPAWKLAIRSALDTMTVVYPNVSQQLQNAISNFLREFRCEVLLEKLLDWPAGHLSVYAELSRMAHPDFIDILMAEMTAQTSHRRQRGIRAARIYGLDQAVEELILNKLDDPNDDVRVEAIHALSDAIDRDNAIDRISMLESEPNPSVHQAAKLSLLKLRGEI